MWRILELLVLCFIFVLFITEFVYPLLTNKPLFGSFREKEKKEPKNSLEEKINEAKTKVNEVKEVQKDVLEHYKSAEQLKQDSDNLLK